MPATLRVAETDTLRCRRCEPADSSSALKLLVNWLAVQPSTATSDRVSVQPSGCEKSSRRQWPLGSPGGIIQTSGLTAPRSADRAETAKSKQPLMRQNRYMAITSLVIREILFHIHVHENIGKRPAIRLVDRPNRRHLSIVSARSQRTVPRLIPGAACFAREVQVAGTRVLSPGNRV